MIIVIKIALSALALLIFCLIALQGKEAMPAKVELAFETVAGVLLCVTTLLCMVIIAWLIWVKL